MTTTTGADTCEADLEACSDEDLDAYLAFADCYEADCTAILDCGLTLAGALSPECLGTGTTGTTTATE